MNMHTTSGFPNCDFRCKGCTYTIFISKITDYPFGNNQLFCRFFHINGQKFYFILFVVQIVDSEIAYFRMSILYLTSALRNKLHCLNPKFFPFIKWS